MSLTIVISFIFFGLFIINNIIFPILFISVISLSYISLNVFVHIINVIIFLINSLCFLFIILIKTINYYLFKLKNIYEKTLKYYNIIPKFKYLKKFKIKLNTKNKKNYNCPICLENKNINNILWIYPCAHNLCTECYKKYNKYDINKCHLCRMDILHINTKNKWNRCF